MEIISVVIICILCTSLTITTVIALKNAQNDRVSIYSDLNTSQVCTDRECVKAALDIMNQMDENVNPCDDFYKFACGGWLRNVTIPGNKGYISRYTQSEERLDIQLKELVENSKESTPAIIKMKHMYTSCMNLSDIESNSMKHMVEVVETLGGWPVVVGNVWDINNRSFDWIEVTEKMRKMGFSTDMFVSLSVALRNSRYLLWLDEAKLGIDRKYLTANRSDSKVKVYHKLMVDTAILLGANDQDRVEQEMWDVIELESQIAKATHDSQSGERIKYKYLEVYINKLENSVNYLMNPIIFHIIKIFSANSLRPGYEWIKFVNAITQLNESIIQNQLVFIDSKYIAEIEYIIYNEDQFNRRRLANYMIWRLVLESLPIGSKRMRDMSDNLHNITGKTVRWKTCLSEIKKRFSLAISLLYIKHSLNNSFKEEVTEMVEYMRNEFKEILVMNDWIDAKSKREALQKLRTMNAIIGYPTEFKNDTLVNDHYKALNITKTNYDLNVRKLRIWTQKIDFENLNSIYNPKDWKNFTSSVTVNAYNLLGMNSIEIPAGILRDIFFNSDRPQYLNFANIGFTIGHEIAHGFDNQGIKFDEIGNKRNLLKSKSMMKYREKTKCMIEQYNSYNLSNGLKINGDLTLGENIADNGGFKVAYNTYVEYTKKFGEEPQLPGLKYTPKQLFWISAAMESCTKYSHECLKTILETDTHSPSEARVNVPFGNSEDFSQNFHCKPGSKMNPIEKCTVW